MPNKYSLKDTLPICKNILRENGKAVCLVKPLYEVTSKNIRRNGNINDYEIIKNILIDLCDFFNKNGFFIKGITNSPITGNKGTLEYFLYITWGDACKIEYDTFIAIEEALEKSFQLTQFDKNRLN